MKPTASVRLLGPGALVLLVGSAEAHGEEVFDTLLAQGAVVIVGTLTILVWRAKTIRKLVTLGCGLLGVLFSWIATAQVPYMDNRQWITPVFAIVPVIGGLVGAYISRVRKSGVQQT